MNKEMLKGTIDLLILAVLTNQDSYGYQVSKTVHERSKTNFEIQEATLYLALKRLEKKKAIESYWGTETQGGKRKYYHITNEGKSQLGELTQDFSILVDVVEKFI